MTIYDNLFISLIGTQYADKINSQFFSPSGKKHFLSYNNILLKDFSSYANSVTNSLVKHVEKFGFMHIKLQTWFPFQIQVYINSRELMAKTFNCEDVFSFMGQKLDPKFLGEIVSDYRKRPVSYRIKHRMKSNSIKMYNKFSVLRIEMALNLYRYTEVSKASNKRYIDALINIIPKESIIHEINEICRKTISKKKLI